MDLLTSDNKNLEKVIETMIHEGKYFPPEPYQNLENALRKVQQAYLMYRMRNAPENRLELLRQYMEDCQALLMKAKAVEETPEQMAEKLAQMGAAGAAEEEMKIAGEEQMIEEQLASAPPPEEIIEEQSEEIIE
jgi:hypothetical protein